MLADLLEVRERVLLATHNGGHAGGPIDELLVTSLGLNEGHSPTERGLLELLAPVETVSELEQTAVVFADRDNQVAARVELSERELVVVLVVEDVEQAREERVEVLRRPSGPCQRGPPPGQSNRNDARP
mgnify:FL=1